MGPDTTAVPGLMDSPEPAIAHASPVRAFSANRPPFQIRGHGETVAWDKILPGFGIQQEITPTDVRARPEPVLRHPGILHSLRVNHMAVQMILFSYIDGLTVNKSDGVVDQMR